jgi:hypothetical protein
MAPRSPRKRDWTQDRIKHFFVEEVFAVEALRVLPQGNL